MPHVLVTEVARDMAAGDLDLALVTGGEALATVRVLKKAGERPHWSFRPAERRPFPMDMEFDPSEVSHAVFEAYLTFALFDNARRAHLGRGLEAHRESLGRVMSRMTDVAAASPHAWFPVARSSDEIAGVTVDNRMVAYPYTKLMTSIMDVDMAAALVIALGPEGGRARCARGEPGVPAGLGVRGGPGPCRRPRRAVALARPGRRLVGRVWLGRESASTRWPISTCTRASPAPSASPSTPSGWPRTILGA